MLPVLLSTILFATFPSFSHVFVHDDKAYILHNHGVHSLDWSPLSDTAFNNLRKPTNITLPPLSTFSARPIARRDLQSHMSPVRDQGARSTCGTFAAIALVEHLKPTANYSEQCQAYLAGNGDRLALTTHFDYLQNNGVYTEADCPYKNPSNDPRWGRATAEQREALITAARQTIPNLSRLPRVYPKFSIQNDPSKDFTDENVVQVIKSSITKGHPVGVTTYVFGEQWQTGLIDTLPTQHEIDRSCRTSTKAPRHKDCAAHAFVLTGFDDAKRLFYFKNSWNASWGLNAAYERPRYNESATGYGAMSYEYFAKYRINEIITLAS